MILALGTGGSSSLPWMPTLGVTLDLRLDGLGMLFSLLVLVIGAGVLAYSARYLGSGRHSGFYALMTAFAASMLLLVLTDDVVVLFVAWELTTLCSFLLIGRTGPHAKAPAIRTLLVTAAGGLSLLAAVATMVVATGTTSLSAILADAVWGADATVTIAVAVLTAIAALTKSAQFPFQAWLPDSMVAITPVSAYLHAAAMVKAGIYLLLRFSPVFADVPVWNALLISAGLATALLGAVAALRRHDLKELLAYSTISQLGLLVTMIGVGTRESLMAACVHTVAHALFKAALFMHVGVIDHQAGTRDMRELAHMRLRMPVTQTAIAVAALSMAGVPPLLGFISKETMFESLLSAPFGTAWAVVITTAAATASVLTFAYSGRMVLGARGGKAARGDEGATSDSVTDSGPAMWLPPVLCSAAGVVLGFTPWLLDGLISDAATSVTGTTVDAHLALWHGLNVPLLVSAIVIALGVALVLQRVRVSAWLDSRAFPFSALRLVDAAQDRIIGIGAVVGRITGTTSPRRHLGTVVVTLVVIAIAGAATVGELPPPAGDLTGELDWVLIALVAVGVLAAMRAATRVAAIVVVGVVGFAMTLWFFTLGAADVALTQLLVEILTVSILVLLLRRLPLDFRTITRRRKAPALAIAIAAGGASALGVWALTGRRDIAPAGEYYVTRGEEATGGANIVNTILVDFRAFDTLGELTVLGVAGIAIAMLLRSRIAAPARRVDIDKALPLQDPVANGVFTRTVARVLGPVIVLVSVGLLLRGHQDVGGGFIAALVGGAGIALVYLAAATNTRARIRWPYMVLIGSGIVVGVAAGLLGFLEGSFLTPVHVEVWGVKLTSPLLFDVGVYLGVVGVVIAAFNMLGRPRPKEKPPISEAVRIDPAHREMVGKP